MKLSAIKQLLAGSLSIIKFREYLGSEMDEYVTNSQKKGSNRPVYLEEDTEIHIRNSDGIFLIKNFIKSELSLLEINYIVDGLLLSENVNFESEAFLKEFETLTDPEIHGHLTLERAIKMLDLFK